MDNSSSLFRIADQKGNMRFPFSLNCSKQEQRTIVLGNKNLLKLLLVWCDGRMGTLSTFQL